MTDIPGVLAEADPMLKAEVYADLGLRMIYQPAQELVLVSAAPRVPQRVSEGGLEPKANGTSASRPRTPMTPAEFWRDFGLRPSRHAGS
jgi:hypothetical protein